ncbi:hypothetical protein QE152_g30833 [Popillia japonica]|uniref:Uncharacterized protein n=1 Tax=Popillia japonica TaxID=7064 RepID=A0AAW1JDC2_POPJA
MYWRNKKELSKLISQTKKRFWEELCLEIDSDIWGRAYKIVLKRAGCLTPYEVSMDMRKEIIADQRNGKAVIS